MIKNLNKFKKVFAAACAVAMLGQFAPVGQTVSAAASETKVTYTSSNQNPMKGDKFTVTVNVSNAKDVYAGGVDFRYDPKQVEVDEIEFGSLLGTKAEPNVHIITDNEATVALTLQGKLTNPVSGNGSLAVITLISKKDNCKVDFKTTNNYDNLGKNGFTTCVKLSGKNGEKLPYTATDLSVGKEEAPNPSNPLKVDFSMDKPSGKPAGTAIKFTAKATGGKAPYNYKFYAKEGSKLTFIQKVNYSSVTWAPATKGTYTVGVVVTDANGVEVRKETSYTATNPLPAPKFFINKNSGIKVGTPVVLNADWSYGTKPLTFKYYAKINGELTWVYKNSAGSATWIPNKAGTYLLGVSITDAKGQEVRSERYFKVVE